MNIITTLNYQLSQIQRLMSFDIHDGLQTVNYFLCEEECTFLDKHSLQDYLTEQKIENFQFLIRINERCIEIINAWNDQIYHLPQRSFKEIFHSKTVIFSTTDFNAIYLKKDKWIFFNTIKGKKRFTENYEFNSYQIAHIADRCSLILNWITAAYPQTIPKRYKKDDGRDLNISEFKIKGKHYVLAYIFDCYVKKIIPPEGGKLKIENIGRKRLKGKLSPNTFYKNYLIIQESNKLDLNSDRSLTEYFGSNWKDIVLSISDDSNSLSSYLKSIGL